MHAGSLLLPVETVRGLAQTFSHSLFKLPTMAQYWELVNVDKRAELQNGGNFNFWEYLANTPTDQLVRLLRKYHWVRFRVSSRRVQASKGQAGTTALLVRLPQEVIDRIVHFVLEDRSGVAIVCLSLTCSYFFCVLASVVQDAIRHDRAPWAGDRIVFAGDSGAFGGTSWVLNFVTEQIAAEGKYVGWHRRRQYQAPRSIEVYGALLSRVRNCLKRDKASLRRFRRLLPLLTAEPSHIRHGNRKPVLRNLTTKEYVRDEALAESDFAYSLGEVVMVQTISTYSSKDVARLGMQAKWAGHRFDISVMEDVIGDEWTDVSDGALQRIVLAATAGTQQLKKGNGRRAHLCDIKI